jgi:hypothetical protein
VSEARGQFGNPGEGERPPLSTWKPLPSNGIEDVTVKCTHELYVKEPNKSNYQPNPEYSHAMHVITGVKSGCT